MHDLMFHNWLETGIMKVGQGRSSKTAVERVTLREREHEFFPMTEINLMIARGWGNTPREKIPADWRSRRGPAIEGRDDD